MGIRGETKNIFVCNKYAWMDMASCCLVKNGLLAIVFCFCEGAGIVIAKGVCSDPVHMHVSIPHKISIAQFVWLSERKKFLNDLWSVCELKIQIGEAVLFVQRVLCQNKLR